MQSDEKTQTPTINHLVLLFHSSLKSSHNILFVIFYIYIYLQSKYFEVDNINHQIFFVHKKYTKDKHKNSYRLYVFKNHVVKPHKLHESQCSGKYNKAIYIRGWFGTSAFFYRNLARCVLHKINQSK